MPCCHSVLSAAASAASSRSTPSWLHRLHAKGGLSFPSHLHIDDLLYGPPPPPPPPLSSSSNQQHAVALEPPAKAKHPKAKATARKSRRAADADGERSTETEVTVVDTSTDGWKAAKLLVRKGAAWKVRDKKASEVSEPEDLNKGKRTTGLASKMQRGREKEKVKEATLQVTTLKEKVREATLQGNIHASSGDVMKESDDPIQTLKRPRCSEPVPEGQSAGILHLQTTNRGKKNGLASPRGDIKGK